MLALLVAGVAFVVHRQNIGLAEMSSAVENVYEGGATGVDNELLVQPSS